MATTATLLYGTPTALTITLASLATAASMTVGRASTAIDNSSVDAIDVLLGGFITSGTTPTASTQIQIWAFGSYDGGTNYSGGATGTDAALTPQAVSLMRLVCIIPVSSTSNQKYTFGPFSLASLFGGCLPASWGVWVSHNTAVNLNATGGNHEIKYTSVKYESA